MKIALCLHGLFDSAVDPTSKGYDGYEYIKKHILDKFDTDVFVHSWEIDKIDIINKLYSPRAITCETPIDFSSLISERGLNTLTSSPRPPQSVLSHFYSVSEVMKLPHTHSDVEYDIIIKSRFDLGRINRNTSGPSLGNPYPVQCISLQSSIVSNKLYMANWNHFHMGPPDMWFYGSPAIMKTFVTLYDTLYKEMQLNSNFHKFATSIEGNVGDLSNSIAFYKWWMIENNLWDNKITLDTIWE